MADIFPFRGMIYNLEKVGDLSLVTAPPYDVISEKSMDKYYLRHPYNVIRLELGDGPVLDRHRRCAHFFKQWEDQGVLTREESPAFYFYQVNFPLNGSRKKVRKGFIGLCRLEEFGKGAILPHERIHEEQKEDRLKVLRACQANISPIFSLYSDPKGFLCSLFEAHLTDPPLFDFMDEDQIRHSLWSIKDPSLLRAVREGMREKTLFIADGHHRYEAALAYKKENEKAGDSSTGRGLFNSAMMYFCAFQDEGLTILPSHRLLFNLSDFDRAGFEMKLQDYFRKTDYPFAPEDESKVRTRFLQALEEGQEGNVFGLYLHGSHRYTLLRLREESDFSSMMGRNLPVVLQKLDVIILHRLIFEQLLGMEEKDQDQNRIRIIKNSTRAIDLVKEGRFQMVFLMNPPRVEEVQEVASEGEFMPQKSTFFYPKLPTGLVVSKLADDETIDDLIP